MPTGPASPPNPLACYQLTMLAYYKIRAVKSFIVQAPSIMLGLLFKLILSSNGHSQTFFGPRKFFFEVHQKLVEYLNSAEQKKVFKSK